ncbi:hypothetical protein ATCC90586_006272 [Pythium insidiosum]|nr:hypothetical protein ATCC90586_006272 [Pythium insidiosum]
MVEIKTLQPEFAALPSLKRVTLAPCMPPQSPQRVRAMQTLRRIENIRIIESIEQHGAFIYAIGVFYKSPSSHIPIHIRPTATSNTAEVDNEIKCGKYLLDGEENAAMRVRSWVEMKA